VGQTHEYEKAQAIDLRNEYSQKDTFFAGIGGVHFLHQNLDFL